MSGRRMVTVAPWRLATGQTLSVSPTGSGSPLGRCVAPGGGWVNIFGLIAAIHLSAGQPSSARPYRQPEAAWSTGLNGLDTSTSRTNGARPASAAARPGPGLPTTAVVTTVSTLTAPAASRFGFRM